MSCNEMYQLTFFNHDTGKNGISNPMSSFKEKIYTPISMISLVILFIKGLNLE